MTITNLPKRFTAAQVLAVFTTAGTAVAPLTTGDVAEAARLAAGAATKWRDDVAGNADVTKALAELVADGRLVTSKKPGWRKDWQQPGDEQHAYLLRRGDGTNRFYATPEQAAAWKARLEQAARKDAHLTDLGGRLVAAFEAAGLPLESRAWTVHARTASSPALGLILTTEQVQHVLDRLDPR